MTSTTQAQTPTLDWLTVLAIAALATSLNIGLHETSHAVACLAVGSQLRELAALYVLCDSPTLGQAKIVDGVAPFYNLVVGLILLLNLPRVAESKARLKLFLWLFMVMNLLAGSGYFMVSGFANIGDLATVIRGWEPHWLWRVLLSLIGSVLFMGSVWLSLRSLGRFVGGEGKAQFRQTNTLSLLSYGAAVIVVLLASLVSPHGFSSLPVVAGIIGVVFGLSPFLWMIHWFSDKHFVKASGPLLEIQRHGGWLAVSALVVLFYTVVIGRGLQF